MLKVFPFRRAAGSAGAVSQWGALNRQAAAVLPWLCLGLTAVLIGRCAMDWWGSPGTAHWLPPEADSRYAAGLAAQQHWFGVPASPAALPFNVKVLGLWAPVGEAGAGFAVLDDNGRHVVARVGLALSSGWSVAAVQASGVILRRAGADRFVPLARAQTVNVAPVPATPPAVPVIPPPVAAVN